MLFRHLFDGMRLLCKKTFGSFQLLRQQSQLAVTAADLLGKAVIEVVQVVVQITLDFLVLILDHEDLVAVVELGLSEVLVGLLFDVGNPLLVPLFLILIELFQFFKLLLRVQIDLTDGVLQLNLLLLELLL